MWAFPLCQDPSCGRRNVPSLMRTCSSNDKHSWCQDHSHDSCPACPTLCSNDTPTTLPSPYLDCNSAYCRNFCDDDDTDYNDWLDDSDKYHTSPSLTSPTLDSPIPTYNDDNNINNRNIPPGVTMMIAFSVVLRTVSGSITVDIV
eukprot:TRINITY_DN35006_c0_g1_i1.p1 TRINITY_DN35006_c0_g1~~TRINITY_DN35006_c0_g1_i1.p1  ORF type:complete len:145 (-),score=16.28 TRINITY_DN35006_c0_g1_i1:88-522(-)